MGKSHNFYHRACDIAAGEDIVGITVAEDGRVTLEYGEFPENLRCNWAGFLYDLSLTPAMLDDLYPDLRVVSAHLKEGYGHVVVSDGVSRREYRREIVPVDRGHVVLEVTPFDPTVEPQSGNPYWDAPTPTGFMEELRGNFPDGDPRGEHLRAV
ncbi:hypothetical protein AABM36_01280 [Kocuria sp. KSNUG]|uniref:hypothetical protein n=1 Tax=Kocuria sp. KSNUG TaxID=3136676 RepID=UPI003C30E33A